MAKMRLALVTNAAAGGSTDAHDVAERLRRHGADVEVHDARDVAPLGTDGAGRSPGPSDGVDRIVVAGGDGSIAPAAALAQRAGVPLAVVAAGTANDFARALDLPRDLEAACALAADPQAALREVEVGSAGGRPFLNVAAAGLSVAAARAAAPLKPRLGPLAYPLGGLRAGLTGEPLHLRVRVDGEERFAGDAWQVVVSCTGHFGGGASTGRTETDDGQIDVTVVPAGRRLALAVRALGMLRGRLAHQGAVAHLRGRTVEVDGAHEFNVDGEACAVDPARFTTAGRVRVVVPAQARRGGA